MQYSRLMTAAVAASISITTANAKSINEFDENCLARQIVVCSMNTNYISDMWNSRYHANGRVRHDYNGRVNRAFDSWKLSLKVFTSLGRHKVSPVRCRTALMAMQMCMVIIEIPSADDITSAIREGNDNVLKSLLEGLATQSSEN